MPDVRDIPLRDMIMNPVANGGRGAFVRALACTLVLACSVLAGAVQAQARDVVVFAAASLKNALDDAAAAWAQETGRKAVISYAASNVLGNARVLGGP